MATKIKKESDELGIISVQSFLVSEMEKPLIRH